MKKKGFTLIELLVVIAIIAMLLAILMPALNKVKKIAMRVVCGTNLKGLGTAQNVYANDYNDQWAKQGKGRTDHTWSNYTSGWQSPDTDFGLQGYNLSIGSHLYLLVREADVSPKSFICPASDQKAYDGTITNTADNPDLVELWDFGRVDHTSEFGPTQAQSYSYQNPWGSYAAAGTRSAQFASMADRSPWFDGKLTIVSSAPGGDVDSTTYIDYVRHIYPYWEGTDDKPKKLAANAQPHDREGQNVLFSDGHNEFAKTSDVGVKHDNIYTIHGGNSDPQRWIRQGLKPPMAGSATSLAGTNTDISSSPQTESGITPTSTNDSILLADDLHKP